MNWHRLQPHDGSSPFTSQVPPVLPHVRDQRLVTLDFSSGPILLRARCIALRLKIAILRWTPIFGCSDKVGFPSREAFYQEHDDRREARDGVRTTVRLRHVTEPDAEQKTLLRRLGLTLARRPK
jgi:hypothetical protein